MENYKLVMLEEEQNLDNAIEAYNKAVREKNLDEMKKTQEACDNARKSYNDAARVDFYEKAFAVKDADPLVECLKRLQYDTLSYTDTQGKDDAFPTRKKTTKQTPVKLSGFREYADKNKGVSVGVERNFLYHIEKFANLMTFYAMQELGLTPDEIKKCVDTYAIRDVARQIEMGKTPTSKNQILKALQQVVDVTIGSDYKATSHDAAFIRMTFAKRSRKMLSVMTASYTEMSFLVAQVCHRILLGKDYKVEYKTVKDA